MIKQLKELNTGQVVDAVSGANFTGVALRDLNAGDKLQRADGRLETVAEKTVTAEGFVIVRTTRGE